MFQPGTWQAETGALQQVPLYPLATDWDGLPQGLPRSLYCHALSVSMGGAAPDTAAFLKKWLRNWP